MKHINSLPDLVLSLIFSKLPLVDLITAGRVCPLWKSYQMETSAQVHSLSLLIGPSDPGSLITNSCFTQKYCDVLRNDDGTRMYLPQHLPTRFRLKHGRKYEWFSFDYAAELVRIFPRVSKLELAINVRPRHGSLGPIVALLIDWSRLLKSVKIYLQHCEQVVNFSERDKSEFDNLLAVLNSLSLLEHLTLDFGPSIRPYFFPNFARPKTVDLPILGQLSEFYFSPPDHVLYIIEQSLRKYAVPNGNLTQIGLECLLLSDCTLDTLRHKFPPLLTNRIVRIPSINSVTHSAQLSDILPHFSSLTNLKFTELSWNRLLFEGALNYLSLLPHLTHLQLVTKMSFFKSPTQEVPRAQLAQLSSIQVLTICVTLPSSTSFESPQWAYLFPQVQVIELLIDLDERLIGQLFLSKEQLQLTLAPFAQCPKLHHLYTREKPFSYMQHYNEWIVLQVRDRKIITLVEN